MATRYTRPGTTWANDLLSLVMGNYALMYERHNEVTHYKDFGENCEFIRMVEKRGQNFKE